MYFWIIYAVTYSINNTQSLQSAWSKFEENYQQLLWQQFTKPTNAMLHPLQTRNLVRVSAQPQTTTKKKGTSHTTVWEKWVCLLHNYLYCTSWSAVATSGFGLTSTFVLTPSSLVTSGSSNGKSVSFIHALCSTVPETGEVEIMWLDDSDAVSIKGLLGTDIFTEGLTKQVYKVCWVIPFSSWIWMLSIL